MAMHHIADTEEVLRAFHALLVPGGKLCLADLDTEPGTFHPTEMADIVHHHGFDRERLGNQLAEIGFVQTKDVTVTTFTKPVGGQGEQKYVDIMDALVIQGAEAIILGCTEIGLVNRKMPSRTIGRSR